MFAKFRKEVLQRSADDHSSGEPHVLPLKVYFIVFASLMVLTVVTVGVSLLGLPPVPSIIAAILVAAVKATIVAVFFMHLIAEDKFYSVILVSTVFFMLLFFGLTLLDMDSRGFKNPEESLEYWQQFSHEKALTEEAAPE